MTILIFMDIAAENAHPLYDTAPRATFDRAEFPN